MMRLLIVSGVLIGAASCRSTSSSNDSNLESVTESSPFKTPLSCTDPGKNVTFSTFGNGTGILNQTGKVIEMKCTAISDRQAGSRMGKSKIGSCIQKNSKSDYKIDVNFTSGITTSFQAVLTISEIPKTVFMNCYPAANSGGGDNTDSVSSVCPKENSSINCMPGSQTPPDCRSPRREWIEKHCKNVSFLD